MKRHEKPISWDRVPFAIAPILTSQDLTGQRDKVRLRNHSLCQGLHLVQFLEIWSEDGVTGEPEEDVFE